MKTVACVILKNVSEIYTKSIQRVKIVVVEQASKVTMITKIKYQFIEKGNIKKIKIN